MINVFMNISKKLVYTAISLLVMGYAGAATIAMAQDSASASDDFSAAVQQGQQDLATQQPDAVSAESAITADETTQAAQGDGQNGLTEVTIAVNQDVPPEATPADTQSVESSADVQQATSNDSATSGDNQSSDNTTDQSAQDQGTSPSDSPSSDSGVSNSADQSSPDQGTDASNPSPSDSGSSNSSGQ